MALHERTIPDGPNELSARVSVMHEYMSCVNYRNPVATFRT